MGQATATSPGPPRGSFIPARYPRETGQVEQASRTARAPLWAAPKPGKRCWPRQLHLDWLGVDPTSHPEQALRFLFHDCDPQTQQWALGTLRLFNPGPAVYQHRPEPLPSAVRRAFILPVGDRTLRPEWVRQAARQRLGAQPAEVGADQFGADLVSAAVRSNPHRNQLGICSPVSGPVAAREADPAASLIHGDHDGQGVTVFGALRSFHPLRRRKRCLLLLGRGKGARRVLERGQPDLPVVPPVAALHGVDAHPRSLTLEGHGRKRECGIAEPGASARRRWLEPALDA